jgi:hypothetical protein
MAIERGPRLPREPRSRTSGEYLPDQNRGNPGVRPSILPEKSNPINLGEPITGSVTVFDGQGSQVLPTAAVGSIAPSPDTSIPSATKKKLTIEEARALVMQNAGIADFSGIRQRFFDSPEVKEEFEALQVTPAQLVTANRDQNLMAPELQQFLNEAYNTNRRIKKRVMKSMKSGLAAAGIARKLPLDADKTFTNPSDMIIPLFEEVFGNERSGLLKKWMKQLDKYVARSSKDNLADIDVATVRGETLKKDIVLVGGGPLSALMASILGPYYNVTVITDQRSVGFPWRARPLYINSSAEGDLFGKQLPLLDGTTTPVTLQGQGNNLNTSILTKCDTSDILCDDGTTRKYISGLRFGDFIATEQVFNADDFIVGQTVLVDQTFINQDGTQRLTLRDANDRIRQIDASAVFFLTGPGKEVSKFEDIVSGLDYRAQATNLEDRITGARQRIGSLKQIISELDSIVPSRNFDKSRVAVAKATFEQELREITVPLPKILNLTSIEKIYDFWLNDLDSDPDRFPLADLLQEGVTIANIGGKDTSSILKELADGNGPDGAYPPGLKEKLRSGRRPRTTLYNEPAKTPEEAANLRRRRYKGVVTVDTETVPDKVKTCQERGRTVYVTTVDDNGIESAGRFFDYAFVGTGYERTPIETLSPIFNNIVYDIDALRQGRRLAVGRGNYTSSTFAGGSAAGLPKSEYPQELQNIIDGLGIPENSISAWLNALLLERMGWSFLIRNGVNSDKVSKLSVALAA